MRLIIALGGNALMQRGEPLDPASQRRNLAVAAEALVPILHLHDAVITHGNGPQVGLLGLQSAALGGPETPLDVLGAESEGMIGYVLEQELASRLQPPHAGTTRKMAVLLSQTIVDAKDPAFAAPTKPIGPVYDAATAKRLAAERHWVVAEDGAFWRRVVASPAPLRILEIETIRLLVDAGVIVICAGGGGVPVVQAPDGTISGVEAVIDKDAASALLASDLGADVLMMLTDVSAVMTDFGTPQERALKRATPKGLAQISFPAGSMGPKIAAAVRVASAGKTAVVGALADAARLLDGTAGTTIAPDGDGPALVWW
jgi:carbamate kinase